MIKSIFVLFSLLAFASAFIPISTQSSQRNTQLCEKKKGFLSGFFNELDAFVDDATNRRLGNGAAFYGKRKSSFYGETDFQRKLDKDVADPMEDYQGPKKAGYFQVRGIRNIIILCNQCPLSFFKSFYVGVFFLSFTVYLGQFSNYVSSYCDFIFFIPCKILNFVLLPPLFLNSGCKMRME